MPNKLDSKDLSKVTGGAIRPKDAADYLANMNEHIRLYFFAIKDNSIVQKLTDTISQAFTSAENGNYPNVLSLLDDAKTYLTQIELLHPDGAAYAPIITKLINNLITLLTL